MGDRCIRGNDGLRGGLSVSFDPDPSFLGGITVAITIVGWVGWTVWHHRLRLSALFGPLPQSLAVWGSVAAMLLATNLFESAEYALLVPWLEEAAPPLADWYRVNAVGDLPSGTWAYLARVAPPVLGAPLLEEVFFRGLLYQRWVRSWGRPRWALMASALAFAAVHGNVVGTFLFAVVATLLYVQARSLWAPIAFHAIGNGIAARGGQAERDASRRWIETRTCAVSYASLFRHRWPPVDPASGESTKIARLGGVVLVLVATACAGLFAEEWLRAVRPGVDPVQWMSAWALPAGALYVVGRGYQGAPNLRPYLSFPISRKQLIRFGLGHALLHPINVLLLTFGLAFWARSVVPAHPWMGSVAYGGGLLLGLGIATHLARLFSRVLAKRPVRVASLLAVGGLLFGVGLQTGLVANVSGWLFGGLLELHATPALFLIGSYAGTHALHRRQVRRRLYLDEQRDARDDATRDAEAETTASAGATGRDETADTTAPRPEGGRSLRAAPRPGTISRGVDRLLPLGEPGAAGTQLGPFLPPTVRALVAMEWRLVSRNRQPRRLGMALVLPFFLVLLVGGMAATSATVPYEGIILFLWGGAVGGWVLDYGSKALSWEGRRLEGILTRAVRPRDLLWAKGTTLGGGTLLLWLLPLPVLPLVGPAALALHTALLVYVLGWGLPLAAVGAPFNGTPVVLNDRSLVSASEFEVGRGGVTLLLLGPAVGLFYWADTLLVFASGLALIGGLSALFGPLWLRLLRLVWERRHPEILEDFREAEG